MRRAGSCLVLAVVMSVLAAATALAGGSSVSVSAPFLSNGSHTIYGNDEFSARVTGHTPRVTEVVLGFDGMIVCKASYKAEHHAYRL
jgi:hypothetical protein